MIRPGLVSVTFRQLSMREIVDLAAANGLEGIEWGGDVHVPAGDLDAARSAKEVTRDAGLKSVSYGSYWRGEGPFEEVLAAAVALGAPNIRVWAGRRGSLEEPERGRVIEALRGACELAASADLTVSLEYHGGTLTDTLASTLRLISEIDHPALRAYWQPVPERGHGERIEEVRSLLPFLSHLHVFQWSRSGGETRRHPLAEGEAEWREYLTLANHARFAGQLGEDIPLDQGASAIVSEKTPSPSVPPSARASLQGAPSPDATFLLRSSTRAPQEAGLRDRFAFIEFVPYDDPNALPKEAAMLRRWLSEIS